MRRHVVWSALVVSFLVLAPAAATAETADDTGGGDGVVTGLVWLDLDGDGDRQDGEPGLGGVQVTLRTDASILDVAATGPDGQWVLRDVQPGTYDVLVEPPADLVLTGGTLAGADAVQARTSVRVDSGTVEAGSVGLGSPVRTGTDVAAVVDHDTAGSTAERLVWTATAHNLGDAAARGPVHLRVVLVGPHEAVTAEGAGWDCDVAASIVLCETASDLPAAASLPPIELGTRPVEGAGSTVSATGTVRLEGLFDAAPLNDEDAATASVSAAVAVAEADGDGAAEITDAGAPASGLLVAGLVALVLGACAVRTGRRTSPRP